MFYWEYYYSKIKQIMLGKFFFLHIVDCASHYGYNLRKQPFADVLQNMRS